MINLTREEAQKVLDALEEAQSYTSCQAWSPSMTDALRESALLIKTAFDVSLQNPASWAVQEGANLHDVFLFKDEADEMCHLKGSHAKTVPLYTAPPQREWVGLTDEEISNLWCKVSNTDFVTVDTHAFSRAIETKLKEKNT